MGRLSDDAPPVGFGMKASPVARRGQSPDLGAESFLDGGD